MPDLTATSDYLTERGAQASRTFKAGTLLYSNSGATLGVPKLLRMDACANDGVVGFESLAQCLTTDFLYWYLRALTLAIRDMVKQGSGQPNLNTEIVGSIRIGLPPAGEQVAIVGSIKATEETFSNLSAQCSGAIELLIERRAALISAAVTGKIDVRGIAPAVDSSARMPRQLNLRWAEPRQPCSDWNCKPDSVVWISTEKLDAAWKQDADAYIGVGGTGAAIEGRYEQFGKWLLSTGGPVELPAVGLDDDGSVGFIDGRHRFAWLRDHGVHSMPVQVSADQAVEIESRFGATDKTSFMPT